MREGQIYRMSQQTEAEDKEPPKKPPPSRVPPRRKRTGNHEVERVSPARAARSAASCPISAPIMNTIDV